MVIAIDKDRKWDFITSSDLARKAPTPEQKAADKEGDFVVPPESQTVFHLHMLSPSQLADITDMGMVQSGIGGKVQFRGASQVIATLLAGLAGWSNLRDAKGDEVPCPEDRMERIALLPEEVRIEIAKELRYNAELTATEGN